MRRCILVSAEDFIVGICGIRAALRTLKAVEKQANEMVNQAALMKEQIGIAEKAANAAAYIAACQQPWKNCALIIAGEGMRLGGSIRPSVAACALEQ